MQVEANEVLKPKTRRRIPQIVIEGERGQVIVLIALLVVILLGFTALAIDGGGLFLLQRDAQNAADSAALAGAYSRCTGGNVRTAAEERAELDGFSAAGGDTVTVNCSGGTCLDVADEGSQYVEVIINAEKPSYFAHLIFSGPLEVTVRSLGECLKTFDPDAARAIVSLAPCTGPNACPGPNVDSSGATTVIEGGIASGCGCEFTGSDSQISDGVSCVPEGTDPVYGTCQDMGANWPNDGGSGNATCPDGETPDPEPETPVDPFANYWKASEFDTGGMFADWAERDTQCAGVTVSNKIGRWPTNDTNGDCYTNLNNVSAGGSPAPSNNGIRDYYFEGLYYINSGELRIKKLFVGPAGVTFVVDDDARIWFEDIEPLVADGGTALYSVQAYDVKPELPATDPVCVADDTDPRCFDPGPNQLPLAFSLKNSCGTTTADAGFSINGSKITWSGIVYVPFGGCNWTGADQVVYGAYVCRITDLSSSNSEIYFDPSMLPSVPPSTRYGPG